jgi:hypothetical protein
VPSASTHHPSRQIIAASRAAARRHSQIANLARHRAAASSATPFQPAGGKPGPRLSGERAGPDQRHLATSGGDQRHLKGRFARGIRFVEPFPLAPQFALGRRFRRSRRNSYRPTQRPRDTGMGPRKRRTPPSGWLIRRFAGPSTAGSPGRRARMAAGWFGGSSGGLQARLSWGCGLRGLRRSAIKVGTRPEIDSSTFPRPR